MDLKKHYFMTIAALFFLGLIVAKPGAAFYPVKEERDCKMVKARMQCEYKSQEYKLNYPAIHYQYQ